MTNVVPDEAVGMSIVGVIRDEDGGTTVAPSPLEHEGVFFARLGLTLPENMQYEMWEKIGVSLRRIANGIPWMIGDWLNYGERTYGEMYSQALEESDYTYSALSNMKYVSGVFPLSKRRQRLSFEHHARVASIMRVSPETVEEILDVAEREHLTAKQVGEDARQARIDLGIEQSREESFASLASAKPDFSDEPVYRTFMPNSAWLDDLLSIVMQLAVLPYGPNLPSNIELEEVQQRAVTWAMDHGLPYWSGEEDEG